MKKGLLFLPVLLLAIFGLFSFQALMTKETARPSALIGKPVPDFELPAISEDIPTLTSEMLKGDVALLNIFGSWCQGCHIEHPFLIEIAAKNDIPIYGINWNEPSEKGAAWLKRFGNPYTAIGHDENGRVIIDLGVYGAPETFLIDHKGIIRYRLPAPLTQQIWEDEFVPRILELEAAQ